MDVVIRNIRYLIDSFVGIRNIGYLLFMFVFL
jgi:hypothetical protein